MNEIAVYHVKSHATSDVFRLQLFRWIFIAITSSNITKPLSTPKNVLMVRNKIEVNSKRACRYNVKKWLALISGKFYKRLVVYKVWVSLMFG